MNYADEDYTTTKLITLHVQDVSQDGTHELAPMTQEQVAKYCEEHNVYADAYVDGEWVGSTEI